MFSAFQSNAFQNNTYQIRRSARVAEYTGGWEPRRRRKWAVGKKTFDTYEEALDFYLREEELPQARYLGKVEYAGEPLEQFTVKEIPALEAFKSGDQLRMEILIRRIEASLKEEDEDFLILSSIM